MASGEAQKGPVKNGNEGSRDAGFPYLIPTTIKGGSRGSRELCKSEMRSIHPFATLLTEARDQQTSRYPTASSEQDLVDLTQGRFAAAGRRLRYRQG